MKLHRLLLLAFAFAFALVGVAACYTEDPTTVVVDNEYIDFTVVRAWWATSYLPDSVAPGAEGESERTVPNIDYAYVVVAPTTDPTRLIPLKSLGMVRIGRGETLHLRVSDASFGGNCTSGHALSQDDADFITQRIFPADFASGSYDAATCTFTPAPDGGADAGL